MNLILWNLRNLGSRARRDLCMQYGMDNQGRADERNMGQLIETP